MEDRRKSFNANVGHILSIWWKLMILILKRAEEFFGRCILHNERHGISLYFTDTSWRKLLCSYRKWWNVANLIECYIIWLCLERFRRFYQIDNHTVLILFEQEKKRRCSSVSADTDQHRLFFLCSKSIETIWLFIW